MKLKPCPFCGNNEAWIVETDSGIMGLAGEYYVSCFNLEICGAQTANWQTKTEAARAWNRRAKLRKARAEA
jgi:Lar family restriction alleviation protein